MLNQCVLDYNFQAIEHISTFLQTYQGRLHGKKCTSLLPQDVALLCHLVTYVPVNFLPSKVQVWCPRRPTGTWRRRPRRMSSERRTTGRPWTSSWTTPHAPSGWYVTRYNLCIKKSWKACIIQSEKTYIMKTLNCQIFLLLVKVLKWEKRL